MWTGKLATKMVPMLTGRTFAVLVLLGAWLAMGGWNLSQALAAENAGPHHRSGASSPGAREFKLPITRDTWVSAYTPERDGNNGGESKLKTKGQQEMTLLDFEAESLRGWVVEKAVLMVHCQTPAAPQRRVTLSTIATPWTEGSGVRYARQRGSASFRWAMQDVRPWAYPGSDLTAATLGGGHTFWRFADASPPDSAGYQAIPMDPSLIAARIAGLSQGLCLYDDVGSEYVRKGESLELQVFPNRYLSSREAGAGKQPYVRVTLGEEDRQPPGEVALSLASLGSKEREQVQPGDVLVRMVTPADAGPAGVLGFAAVLAPVGRRDWDSAAAVRRDLIPLAGAAGDAVLLHVRDMLRPGEEAALGVRAVDAAGNAGAATWLEIKGASDLPLPWKPASVKPWTDASGAVPVVGDVSVAVIDALDKVHPVTGQMTPAQKPEYLRANHLWSSKQRRIRLHAARNEFVAFQVLLWGPGGQGGPGGAAGVSVSLDPQAPRRLRDDAGLPADAGAEPLPRLLQMRYVPAAQGAMPDPLVPCPPVIRWPEAELPGQTHAALLAEFYVPHQAAPGVHQHTLVIKAGTQQLDIPIELHVWDFTLPDELSFVPQMNAYGQPAAEQELSYYRMAHEHRTCLNRLAYNWNGKVPAGQQPRSVEGGRWDWTDYDLRLGPLLDGSAFASMPRRSVPVDAFYLPLNENWPVPIDAHFKTSYWIEEALGDSYWNAFEAGARQWAQHIAQRRWNRTGFEFFLNGKIIFKGDRWTGRCSAPWNFDEPVHTQDFWALRHFGEHFRRAVEPYAGQARLQFRADISYPQWQRDLLDGVLDINVVSAAIRPYHRTVRDRALQNNQKLLVYGSCNPLDQSNVQPAAWCVDAWRLGADGIVPWQTLGSAQSWRQADPQALFYPDPATGQALPSLRLKAIRSGQQLAEMLNLYQRSRQAPRWAVASQLEKVVPLQAKFEAKSREDAGTLRYDALTPQQLWELRLSLGEMLSGEPRP